ncbi:methyltransferase domain-containing protein [uncultured Thiodictyon sp.]|uniref:class I SAM-dependent methyltransferase n=1 Tax=uncultured Thiodictyon sp. TaxID=1846217 RepID=UPI0025EEC68C|nr:methyltransferase domain-containing protein [uncultured Thiodictyon sp.]
MTACTGPGSPLAGLEHWYRTPLGRDIAAREADCLTELLHDTFGYYLVQVGDGDCFREVLAASRLRHRVLLPGESPSGSHRPAVVGNPAALPLAADAVDVVLMPHTLDFTPDPRLVLREVERVLIPEGHVIVLGFNALSSWGLMRLLYRYRGRAPWCGRFLTTYRIEDWLSLLGFDVEVRKQLVFRPPLRGAQGPRLAVLDVLGRTLWPALGGVYAIKAVKRVSTLTPLRTSWGARHALLAGGAIEPTARHGASRIRRTGRPGA